MYLADYHMHSSFSPDAADNTMTDMALAAITAGLDEICFTDHIEPFQWGGLDGDEPVDWATLPAAPVDWAAMTAQFDAAQRAVGDSIRLKLGVELGDAGWDFVHTEKLMADAPQLDFIIGSQHTLSKRFNSTDLYYFNPVDEREAEAGIADYLEELQKLANWGHFSVLGHLTLPLRYLNEMRGFQLSYDGHEAEVEDIFRTLIQSGRGIELNTNRGNTPLPDARWLKLYRRMGGEIITLGTDAHSTKHVGCAVRERQQLLRECGFQRFCTFERMQPVWHEL